MAERRDWHHFNLSVLPDGADGLGKQFTYSGEDRLLKTLDEEGEMTTQYAYDAAGERVATWRSLDGSLQEALFFLRDEQGQVLSEWLYTPGEAPEQGSFRLSKDYIVAGTRAIAEVDEVESQVKFLATDHLGSTRAVVLNGTLSEEIDYFPFGAIRGNQVPSTKRLFTGHERDLGTLSSEMDYLHARYYNHNLGRFVSVDPISSGQIGTSQSWNAYAYAGGNPLRNLDPDGADFFDFVNGVANGLGSSMFANAGRVELDNGDYQLGQAIGDLVAIPTGALEFNIGAGGEVFGVSLTSTGVGALPGVPAMAISAGIMAQGAAGVTTGATNLARRVLEGRSGGGKTGRKASRDSLESGQERIDKLRQELKDASSKTPRTPEIKQEIKKKEKELKRAINKMRKSEEHARKSQKGR